MKRARLLTHRSGQVALTSSLIIAAAWALSQMSGLSPLSSVIPRIIISGTLLLLLVQLALDLLVLHRSKSHASDLSRPRSANGRERRRVWLALLCVILLPATTWLLGIVPGTALLTFVFLRWYAGESWRISIFYPLLMTLAAYLLLAGLMGVNLFGGLIA